jgi:sulfur carrier protein
MRITINGEPRVVADGSSVADAVADLAAGRRAGIAVSLNGEVVPRSAWAAVAIGDDDKLEVLSAIGGG